MHVPTDIDEVSLIVARDDDLHEWYAVCVPGIGTNCLWGDVDFEADWFPAEWMDETYGSE